MYFLLKLEAMKTQNYTIGIGLQLFAVVAAFFLLMKVLGLAYVTELRFVNILFVIYFSNKIAKSLVEDFNEVNYLLGLKTIFLANALNVVLSVGALSLYILLIDPMFLKSFENGILIGGTDVSISKVAVGVFMEGMAGSAIVSFALMQYWKNEKRSTKSVDMKKL